MASVKCPACGERVKVRDDEERLRCRECGKSFRPPEDDEDEEKAPTRKRRKPVAKSSSGTKLTLIVVGSVLALALVVVAVVLLVRGQGGKDSDAPMDQAKVTADNFNRVKPGMDLREVEGVLGGSRASSEDDMRDAFRKGLGDIEAGMEVGFARFGEGAEWRRWDGKNFRVWVAFGQTKEGKRAAFSTALEQNGSAYTRHDGFFTWQGPMGHDLDELNAQRKKEDAVRNDSKWTRGASARDLVLGEWRNDQADGLTFGAGGRLTEFTSFGFPIQPGKEPTYRVLDERHLETTHRPQFDNPPPPPPLPNGFVPPQITFKDTVRKYEYLVNADELALVEVTPHATHAGLALKTYYRMPARAGGAAHTKLIAPMMTDVRTGSAMAKQSALYKLERLGKGAAVAGPELRGLAQKTTDVNLRRKMEDVARIIEAK